MESFSHLRTSWRLHFFCYPPPAVSREKNQKTTNVVKRDEQIRIQHLARAMFVTELHLFMSVIRTNEKRKEKRGQEGYNRTKVTA